MISCMSPMINRFSAARCADYPGQLYQHEDKSCFSHPQFLFLAYAEQGTSYRSNHWHDLSLCVPIILEGSIIPSRTTLQKASKLTNTDEMKDFFYVLYAAVRFMATSPFECDVPSCSPIQGLLFTAKNLLSTTATYRVFYHGEYNSWRCCFCHHFCKTVRVFNEQNEGFPQNCHRANIKESY